MIKLWTFCRIALSHLNFNQVLDFTQQNLVSCLQTGMAFIDLQKTIDNNILIKKKKLFLGFTNEIIKWYRSYVSQKCLLSVQKMNIWILDKDQYMCATRFNFGSTSLFNLYQRHTTGFRECTSIICR